MVDVHRYLEALSPLSMRFGLHRMERALDALGRPERSAPVLHVAGTNGKGSTCAMAAAALRAAGLRTGCYTSPHLERFNVRAGRRVRRGDVIGFVGSTGRSNAPHLHYEVWLDDKAQDPVHYILDEYRCFG